MQDLVVAGSIFVLLVAASLGALLLHPRMPSRFREDETARVIGQVISLFVVMTSLALGLMLNQARTTFGNTQTGLHALATDVILLDRALSHYGPDTVEGRRRLLDYVKRAVHTDEPADPLPDERVMETMLDGVGQAIDALKPDDPAHADLQRDLVSQFHALVQLRWTILQEADGITPPPLLMLVTTWLVLIFGSFGYRAPRNLVIVVTLVLSAGLVAATFYLLLDMDKPFRGTMQVSPAPLERAIVEMQH